MIEAGELTQPRFLGQRVQLKAQLQALAPATDRVRITGDEPRHPVRHRRARDRPRAAHRLPRRAGAGQRRRVAGPHRPERRAAGPPRVSPRSATLTTTTPIAASSMRRCPCGASCRRSRRTPRRRSPRSTRRGPGASRSISCWSTSTCRTSTASRCSSSPGPATTSAAPSWSMLTSDRQPGDLDRCRELQIAAHLDQAGPPGAAPPGRRRGHRPARRRGCTHPAGAAGARHRRWPYRLRVLVAEDNAVNQKLARAMLMRLGHTSVLASDGREAIAEWGAGGFDVIFMDVQMPDLDGFDATREIRRLEAGTGVRVPIVAMTAHAMPGDRERCLGRRHGRLRHQAHLARRDRPRPLVDSGRATEPRRAARRLARASARPLPGLFPASARPLPGLGPACAGATPGRSPGRSGCPDGLGAADSMAP